MNNIDLSLLFEEILENVSVGVMFRDADESILFMNNSFCRYSNQWLLNETIPDKTSFKDSGVPEFLYIHQQVLENKKMHVEYKEFRSGQTSNFFMEMRVYPIFDPNLNSLGTLFTMVDITEKMNLLHELEQNRYKVMASDQIKSNFLKNISHEVRTPMNAIIGFSDLLADSDLTPDDRKLYSMYIVDNSYQLLSIIDGCLTLASLEMGQVEVETSLSNVNEICNVLKTTFIGNKGIEQIEFSFFPGLSDDQAILIVDQGMLVQVLSSLLINAFNFTTSGHIHFGYTLEHRSIRFYVENSGFGIPESFMESIFESFSKVDYAGANKGIGLGLAICRHYVQLMGGTIWVESDIEKGTSFYFTIPYRRVYNEIN